jgi:hypothetical protein
MKAPGINISGALEELEATRAGLIDGEDDKEEKAEIEDEAVQIRDLLRQPVAVSGPVGGKGGRRPRRKTRRGKRSGLKRRTRTKYHK